MFPRNSLTWCVAALLAAVVLDLASTPVVHADVVLWGDEQATINSHQSNVTLYDMSRASIVSGGDVFDLRAYNTSNVDISGGIVWSSLSAYDSSIMEISGGSVSNLHAYNSSIVEILGGDLFDPSAHDSSIVEISGGFMHGTLYAYNSSIVDISGAVMSDLNLALRACHFSNVDISGGFINCIFASDSSNVDISGGSVDELRAYHFSNAEISGGLVSSVNAFYSSTVTLNVKDFRLGTGLTLDGERLLGAGVLSGDWMDGTPHWAMNINSEPEASIFVSLVGAGDANCDGVVNDTDASIVGAHWMSTGAQWGQGDFNGDGAVDDKDAAILAAHWLATGPEAANVPEPTSLALLFGGLLSLLAVRRRSV